MHKMYYILYQYILIYVKSVKCVYKGRRRYLSNIKILREIMYVVQNLDIKLVCVCIHKANGEFTWINCRTSPLFNVVRHHVTSITSKLN